MISPEVKTRSSSDKIVVLLVDDEPDFLELSKLYLEMENPSLKIDTCTFVEDALKMLENNRYTVVVSDYQMPGMDGLEFLEALRSQGNNVPFIIFTGRGREEVAIKALNLGVDSYIQKGGDPKSQFGILAQAIIKEASRKRSEERLYESEKKFRAIVTQSQDGMTLTNEAGEIIEWNDAQAQLTQIPVSEAIGQKVWDVQYKLAPNDIRTERYYKQLKSSILNCFETGDSLWLNRLTDYTIERPDGTYRYMQQLPFSIKTQNGIMLCSIMRDITDQKLSEKAVQRTQQQLQDMLDNTPSLVYVKDVEGRYMMVNKQWREQSGILDQEVVGKTDLDLFPQYCDEIWQENEKQVLRSEEYTQFEEISKNTNQVYLATKFMLRNPEGDVYALCNSSIDITDRKRAEEALQLSEEKLRNIIDSLPLGMHMYELKDDGNLVFSDANRAADEILGVDNSQFVGKPIEEAFPYSIETEIPDRYRRAAKLGEPYQIDQIEWEENQIKGAFQVHAFQTSPGRMAALFRDITEIKQAEQKLKESEERFRSIFDNANDGILLAELESRELLLGNATIVNMLGYSFEELKTMTVEDIHPQEQLSLILEEFEKQSKREVSFSQNIPVKRKDGSIFYADINSSHITFSGKSYLVGVLRDVTERKQAEERLHESEKRFRELVENINDVLYEIDKNGIVQYVSSPIKSILEYLPSEIIGQPFIDLVHPDDKQRTLTGVRNVMSGHLEPNEYQILTKSGDIRWILTSSKPVYEGNEVVGLRGVLSDITKRKQKEEELRKSEARYRRLFEESPISLWEEEFSDVKRFIDDLKLTGIEDFRKYFDEHPEAVSECASLINIIDVNQATLDLYGAKSKEELLGNLDKVFTEETYPAFKEELIALAENRNKIAIEVVNKTLKGGTIYVDLGLNISSEDAEKRALISIMDITDRKKAKEREEFLRTLLRHDLTNKIHVVQGYLKLLQDTDLSEEGKKIIKRTSNASKECQHLLEKVWMLSEIDQKEEQTEVNLDTHIQNVITKNQGIAKENQIEIEYEAVPYDVLGGPLLEELFHNLIENAIKHSKCLKIKISGYREDENIKVIVEDDGKGIERDIIEKLHDKSFKGKREGIGTYIINRIAENYGGSVSIKDSKLGGAKFIITLKSA
ncbi:MAG: PAS domain S-box protein [Candidatus Hermodarchaeota archaeon]